MGASCMGGSVADLVNEIHHSWVADLVNAIQHGFVKHRQHVDCLGFIMV